MTPGGRPQGGIPRDGMQDMRVPAGPMMGPPPYGLQPAAYYNPAQGAPPQQMAPMPGMPMGDPVMSSYPMTEGAPCQFCGGYGCEVCACDDFDMKLLRWILPYGAGGCGAQRWYDIYAEWVTLKRDEIGRDVTFATDGIDGFPVLGTEQLTFSNESGFRVNFAIQLSAGNLLETSYLGTFNWASRSEVTNSFNELFSIYSQFGTDPPPLGFAETDQSALQSIAYSSGFDSIEMNYRQRWVGPNTRIQGSWLAGIRYMYLLEDFRYITASPLNAAASDTLVSTMNSMTGAQIGGDLWVCIMPGLSVGGEAKAGVYGNHASQRTNIQTFGFTIPQGLFPSSDPYVEKVTEDSAAFVADLNVTLLWRLSQNWTFRTGYMFLWMSEVALATDNFNPEVPLAGFAQPRPALIDNGGNLLYHGYTAGFEYLW
jgi:hypothetical protein